MNDLDLKGLHACRISNLVSSPSSSKYCSTIVSVRQNTDPLRGDCGGHWSWLGRVTPGHNFGWRSGGQSRQGNRGNPIPHWMLDERVWTCCMPSCCPIRHNTDNRQRTEADIASSRRRDWLARQRCSWKSKQATDHLILISFNNVNILPSQESDGITFYSRGPSWILKYFHDHRSTAKHWQSKKMWVCENRCPFYFLLSPLTNAHCVCFMSCHPHCPPGRVWQPPI